MIGKTVKFHDWDNDGNEVVITGVVLDEFTDPEDYRPSYSIKVNPECARYPNHHATPYTSDCWLA